MTDDNRKETTDHTVNPADVNRGDEVSSASSPSDTPEPDSTKQAPAPAACGDGACKPLTVELASKEMQRAFDRSNDANRELDNLLKSKASDGAKKKRKRNALVHGVFSDDLVLPWEAPEDFESLHAGFKSHWQPIGPSEEEAVFDLAYLNLIKRRAMKMPQLSLHRDPFAIALGRSGKRSWPDIMAHQPVVAEAATKALVAATAVMSALEPYLLAARDLPYRTPSSSGADFNTQADGRSITQKIDKMADLISKAVSPIQSLANDVEEKKKVFNQAYEPEVIDRQVRSLAAIQVRIEKTTGYLIGLKEHRRLEDSRKLPSLPSPSIALTSDCEAGQVSVAGKGEDDAK